MSVIDWLIITIYIAATIALGFYLGRKQQGLESYYVGDRTFSWWTTGISTMATQTSAISFISIPAFIALRENGGLTWLQYELALPLAMIVAMVFLVPFFRELKLVSIYEYLEQRFDRRVRLYVGLVFLLSRGLGTGVALYAAAIVLAVCIELPLYLTILLVGLATIVYDVAGGIRAVIVSDLVQMAVLVVGVLVCIFYATDSNLGLFQLIQQMPEERMTTIDASLGFSGETQTPFWAFLIGGFFLYLSYYGADQSQAQRGLSVASVTEAKKSLMLNGLCRFPLALLYVMMGIAMYGALQQSTELAQAVANSKPDYLVPYFILLELPAGFRGILFAALLAATMSSLDSALNALSAVTMRDFIEPRMKQPQHSFLASRVTTVIWGLVITGFAFFVGDISDTVIEAINKVGSAFYGPVLATFLSGILITRVDSNSVLLGLVIGVLANLACWLILPSIHWMWWNLSGFTIAFISAVLLSRLALSKTTAQAERLSSITLSKESILSREKDWLWHYLVLLAYFFLILTILFIIA